MANRFGSHVRALHVIDLPRARQFGAEPPVLLTTNDMEAVRRQRQSDLDDFVREHLADADVRAMVETGDAAQLITAVAEAEKSDLVMMPTRGMGPFRRLLIGSVTAKVLHDCPCPVWTSVHADEPGEVRPASGGPILCAVNLEPDSVPLLQWAAKFAAALSAELRVLHVEPAADEKSDNRGVVAVRKYLYEQAGEKWNQVRSSAGVDVEFRLAGGDVSSAVALAAAQDRASLLLIARGRTKGLLGGLKGKAYAIIRESPCPVIAI
jgi:nucleotide-binding universal stress UspA family protein